MFAVIQEVSVKVIPKGEAKSIEVCETHWTDDGKDCCRYGYQYGNECFERPIKRAYRISVHQSYREQGKVKKKQTVICTINYYSVVDWGDWIGDYIKGGLKSKADLLGLEEDALSDLVYTKWQPIVDQIWEEFKQTEEYRVRKKNRQIINEHNQRVEDFTDKYGVSRSEYERCYDVFGKLRNPEYLKKIKADYKSKKEYEQESRRYYEDFFHNYNGSGYCGNAVSNYSETDKTMLKKFYRTLSKAFHPDSNPDIDTSEEMKMLNRLKGEWGV